MKASRRSRGAREMEKKRGKREAEKKKHKGKRRNAGSSPGLRSAPVVAKPTSTGRRATRQPCRLHPRAKLRFAFGLLVGKAAAGRKKWRALGKWWDEIGVGGTERRKPGGWRGRWRLVDFGKMVGRNVRRRPAKPGGRKLAG